jgi:hypothetical protein
MPSKELAVVRFAVGQPDGPQSSVWRLWVDGNDVYISQRDLTSVKKVSLHESGIWRYAWTAEFVAKAPPFLAPGQDRATDKWDRTTLEFLPGVTRAFDILVPASEVTMPKHAEPAAVSGKKKIVWVPSPPEGCAMHFTVLITTAEVTAATSGWPGRRTMGTRFIWKAELPNTQTVWLVALDRPVDDWLRNQVTGFKSSALPVARRKFEEAGQSELGEARVVLYGQDNEQGPRWCIDISADVHD